MNGPIAQLVALVCHANAVLQGRPTPSFFPTNSTCEHCNTVEFVRLKPNWLRRVPKEVSIAPNPDAWFRDLNARECRAILLRHLERDQAGINDRLSAAFAGGGGRWLLEANSGDVSDYYEARWVVARHNAVDKRPWRVTYGLIGTAAPIGESEAASFFQLKERIASTLLEIESFARRHTLEGFAACFRNALDCLESDAPFDLAYHRDLDPQALLPRNAARIAAACQAAWVFGGMGSWNDLGFDGADHDEYESVSDRLFNLLNFAICVAANSTAPPQSCNIEGGIR